MWWCCSKILDDVGWMASLSIESLRNSRRCVATKPPATFAGWRRWCRAISLCFLHKSIVEIYTFVWYASYEELWFAFGRVIVFADRLNDALHTINYWKKYWVGSVLYMDGIRPPLASSLAVEELQAHGGGERVSCVSSSFRRAFLWHLWTSHHWLFAHPTSFILAIWPCRFKH